jgi:hypothetical protein
MTCVRVVTAGTEAQKGIEDRTGLTATRIDLWIKDQGIKELIKLKIPKDKGD